MRISKVSAVELINKSNGKIFTATFKKKDGSSRTMNCRLGVTQGITGKGMNYNPAVKGLKPVFDMQSQGWRMINLDTINHIKIGGKEYEVS